MINAILTDLHANRQAVAACLAHAEQHHAQRYAFLGDFVGYGADPGWVIDTVQHYVARGAIAIMGNHDHATAHETRKKMHAEAREVIDWTRGQLTAAQLDFLRTLPLTITQDNILYVHASAHEPIEWGYVTDSTEAGKSMKATSCHIIFCGHVHAPALYRTADDGRLGAQIPVPGQRNLLRPQHQYLAIPGSVGQPRDGNCAACYALYDDVSHELTFHRVPYDFGAAARRVIEAALPIVFAMRLVEGI
jgi:diadenosine tetraphosphatase ApaH/serine/threonine PP2A family protein phosphatase